MTAKIRAIIAAFFGGIVGFVNWLATVPPEQQSGWLAQLVEITPVEHRPTVGLLTRFLMLFLGVYAVYQASRSGPQTPPQNSPLK